MPHRYPHFNSLWKWVPLDEPRSPLGSSPSKLDVHEGKHGGGVSNEYGPPLDEQQTCKLWVSSPLVPCEKIKM